MDFNCLDALETACMVPGYVLNLGELYIPQFKYNNSVGVISIYLSLALIVLDSYLIYTHLS